MDSGSQRGWERKSVLPKNYLEKALRFGVVLPVQGLLAQNGAEPQEMVGSFTADLLTSSY